MAFRRVDAHCVGCRTPLELVTQAGVDYQRCPTCMSALVGRGELEALFRIAQPKRTLELLVHNDGSTRHDCPVCRDQMEVTWVEFLRFESCEVHGVWLEPAAFNRLMAYDVLPSLGLPKFKRDKPKSQ